MVRSPDFSQTTENHLGFVYSDGGSRAPKGMDYKEKSSAAAFDV